MNILFLCKANVFRSILAEYFFNKYSKKHHAQSAALQDRPYHNKSILEIHKNNQGAKDLIKRHNMELSNYTSKKVTKEMIDSADKIVILLESEDKIPEYLKNNKKVIFWQAGDGVNENQEPKPEEEIELTISKIKDNIKKLVSQLEK